MVSKMIDSFDTEERNNSTYRKKIHQGVNILYYQYMKK